MKKKRLSVLFASGIGVVGVVVILMIITMQQRISEIYEKNLIYITLDDRIKHQTASAHIWFKELLAGDSTVAFETDVVNALENTSGIVQSALEGGHTEIGDFKKTDDHRVLYRLRDVEKSLKQLQKIVHLRYTRHQDSTLNAQTRRAIDREFDRSYHTLHESADNLTLYMNNKIAEDVQIIRTRAFITVVVVGLIFSLLGFFVYRLEYQNEQYATEQQSKLEEESLYLKRLSEFIEKIAEGNFSTEFKGTKHDILTEKLDQMRQKLQLSADESQRRAFVREGQNEINQILRNQFIQSENGYLKILHFLQSYLNITQSGFYLIEKIQEDEVLNLKACIAYNRQKFLERQLHPHEGLTGRCILEKKTIILSEFPKNYLNIVSGLGETPPQYLIIIPLLHNNKVTGVIELASLSPITSHGIEFLENTAETIASAVAGYQATARTKSLLEHAQLQAEQLRAQEEEMRQNTEELSATQEEMRRREAEYLRQIKDLTQQLHQKTSSLQ